MFFMWMPSNGSHETMILPNTDRTEPAVSPGRYSGGVPVRRPAPGFPVATDLSVMAQRLIE